MKVLLIQPPIEDYYTTSIRNYPLGLLFIASAIRDICHVEILDLRKVKKPKKIPSPFPHLQTFYHSNYSPFSMFKSYYRFGINNLKLAEIIKSKKPDIVGISALFTTYINESLEIAKLIKEISPFTKIVFGGNHPTIFPETLLKLPFVDYVIRGEGEEPFRELVVSLMKGVKPCQVDGLCYKDNGIPFVTKAYMSEKKDLNLCRELLPKEDYPYGKGYIAPVLTSRGCLFNCRFCGKPAVKYRTFFEESIKNDISKLIQLGFNTIDFEDDYFNFEKKETLSILKWLADKELNLTAMNGVLPECITSETKKLIKKAGFQRINLSLVDIKAEILRKTYREHFGNFTEIIKSFLDVEVPLEVHFIIGLPGQNVSDVINTISFLAEKKVLLGPSIYYLAPGSTLFNNFVKKVGMPDYRHFRSSALFPCTAEFTQKRLATLFKLARFVNFIKAILDKYAENLDVESIFNVIEKKNKVDFYILKSLLEQKVFLCYDNKQDKFLIEESDYEVITRFFDKVKVIKGFKTAYEMTLK